MKKNILKICRLTCLFGFALLLIFFGIFGATIPATVYAAESEEVLQDLRKDPNFDESLYLHISDDYSLQVIQIAESSNKELFVYVYQPCHDTYDLIGTKISISYGYSLNGSDLSPKLYTLQLVSTSGRLDKYYVSDFEIPSDGDRYYNIVEIFRMVNSELDEIDDTFPKTDIAYSVGQQWNVCDLNNSKHYEMNTFDTLYVDTVFNGNLEFSSGVKWNNLVGSFDSCHSWFYCFNVEDYVIDHIFDADLSYSIRSASKTTGVGLTGEVSYSNERLNQVITLKDTDVMIHNGGGFLADTFEWNRILTSADFVKYVEEQGVALTDFQSEKILSSSFVFTYLETEYRLQTGGGSTSHFYSDVFDVGLLRLHFQDVSGKYYDLGVVNDLTNPDDISDGFGGLKSLTEAFGEFWDMFVKVIFLIVGVILLVLLLNFVAPIMAILKYILKAILFVIALPFKLLKFVFGIGKKKDG